MSAEAQSGGFNASPPASDTAPLKTTQAGAEGDVSPAPKPTPALHAASAPRPFKERHKPSRRQRREKALAAQAPAAPAVPAAPAPAPPPPAVIITEPKVLTVEDHKEIERFRLSVWMAKLFSGSMVVMGFFMMGLYAYQAIATKTVPDMGVMGAIFGHLKEVLVAIFESSK